MTEIQMVIHDVKTVQSAKKLDPTPNLAKDYHFQPTRKRR